MFIFCQFLFLSLIVLIWVTLFGTQNQYYRKSYVSHTWSLRSDLPGLFHTLFTYCTATNNNDNGTTILNNLRRSAEDFRLFPGHFWYHQNAMYTFLDHWRFRRFQQKFQPVMFWLHPKYICQAYVCFTKPIWIMKHLTTTSEHAKQLKMAENLKHKTNFGRFVDLGNILQKKYFDSYKD